MTAQAGLVNPSSLYFDHQLSPFDVSLIRQANIRYVVVDDRLAQGLPLYGIYIQYGEPRARLTVAELNKFNSYPGIKRIYDNGPIQVYDMSGLLPAAPRSAPAGPPAGGSGLRVGVFLLASLVAVMWLFRLRRRSEPFHELEHVVVCGLAGALVVGVFGALLVRLIRVPPDAVAVTVLLVLLALSLRPISWYLSELAVFGRWLGVTPEPSASLPDVVDGRDPHADETVSADTRSTARRPDLVSTIRTAFRPSGSRLQVALGCLGLALFALGASVATQASLKEWTTPPELSLVSGPAGRPLAEVQLGSAGPIVAELEVTTGGETVWRSPLARTTAAQRVDLPTGVLGKRSRVSVVADGLSLREVGS